MFDDPLKCNSDKKTLEQVVGPECSNALDHIQPYQQQGVLLDD
jgi:hypothetical protein